MALTRIVLLAAALCPAMLLLAGCSGINTVTSSGESTYSKVGDVFLDNQIAIEEIQKNSEAMTPSFNVRLANKMWFDMVLEVKMDFYDDGGVKLDNPWGWKPVSVEPKQDEWVKFTAPSGKAKNFKLYVKKADD